MKINEIPVQQKNFSLFVNKRVPKRDWGSPPLYYDQKDYNDRKNKYDHEAKRKGSKRPKKVEFKVWDIKKQQFQQKDPFFTFSAHSLEKYALESKEVFCQWLGADKVGTHGVYAKSRLVIGLGGPSIYENDICLHHLYGFPYIRSSAIKGAVRSWVIFKYFDESEDKAFKDPDFCSFFGDIPGELGVDHGKGNAVFGDAFPTDDVQIITDIINVHYRDYYEKGKEPVDSDDPVVINYLTVEKGAEYQLLYAFRNRDITFTGKLAQALPAANGQPFRILEHLILEALCEWGVGAKTSLGRGRLIQK